MLNSSKLDEPVGAGASRRPNCGFGLGLGGQSLPFGRI